MCNRFEGPALTDAFSRGQLQSKKWLIDVLNDKKIKIGNSIYVCAGWYGVLPALLFERYDVEGHIWSFDIDPSTDNPADTLNKEYIIDGMKFKSFVKDVAELKFDKETYHYSLQISDATQFGVKSTHEIDKPTCVMQVANILQSLINECYSKVH